MTTSSKRQASTAYPAVPKDTLLSISKKTITSFPGLPSLLDVASEIFSKDPIQPENYQRFNNTLDAGDVFLTTYGATIRQQKPVQKKRYIIPKSPFSASGFASNGNEKVWFYIDEQENTQGPFSSSDMDSWFDGGYFFNELLIRFKDQGEFRKLSEMLGKQQEYQQYQQQQQQNYSNDAPQRGFGIARNNSGSNQQQGRTFESKDKFERRTEDKPAAQGGMFSRAKKEEVPLQLSPTEAPKQSSEEKVETKAAEKPQEKSPEIKQEAPVVQKEEIPEAQPEKEVEVPAQEEEVQEEEPEVVDVKKQQAPVDFDDSEWVSIKKTKNKKKGKGNAPAKPEPVRVEPPKPVVKAQTAAPQKPAEQEKSPKKEEPAKVEPVKAKEEEKVVEPKPVEAKVEPPKPLGVSYPFNQNIAPIVGGAKAKKGKTKIIANWLDEDAEEVAVQKELERPTTEKLSSVLDFPSLGGSLVPEKKEPVKAGSKNKNTKEDQQLKQDLLSIQQQQQREEEERKHQMRIKQEEERERKLKQQRDEQAAAEAKPVKKEAPAVTEEEFPSLGMGAKVQEKPAPKKKPTTQAAPAKKEEKPVAAPKQKASPVKATNNPKYAEDFPAL